MVHDAGPPQRLPGDPRDVPLDEFDTLQEPEIRETLGTALVATLRRLMGREGLNFTYSIGSSGRKLENMQASYTEFFNAAVKPLPGFRKAAEFVF